MENKKRSGNSEPSEQENKTMQQQTAGEDPFSKTGQQEAKQPGAKGRKKDKKEQSKKGKNRKE